VVQSLLCWIVCLGSALATIIPFLWVRELLDILDIFPISMVPTASTHHQPHCQASTIDLILSSIPDSLRSTFGCPGISHHDFVGASFEISHIRQPMTFSQRSFRNIDQSALLAAAAFLP
jgi:hypothetical protein